MPIIHFIPRIYIQKETHWNHLPQPSCSDSFLFKVFILHNTCNIWITLLPPYLTLKFLSAMQSNWATCMICVQGAHGVTWVGGACSERSSWVKIYFWFRPRKGLGVGLCLACTANYPIGLPTSSHFYFNLPTIYIFLDGIIVKRIWKTLNSKNNFILKSGMRTCSVQAWVIQTRKDSSWSSNIEYRIELEPGFMSFLKQQSHCKNRWFL